MVVKRVQTRLRTPAPAVADKQDPTYSQADFLRDLERVSQRRRELSRRPVSRRPRGS